MPIFFWSENYEVNHPVIDLQHQQLVRIINDLYDALKEGKANDILGDIFNRLVRYTITHFHDEERIMIDNEYPGKLTHMEIHRDLIKKVHQYQQKFEKGETGLSVDVLNFLNNWLTSHILNEDKKIGNWIALRN